MFRPSHGPALGAGAACLATLALGAGSAQAASSSAVALTAARCVPATKAACRARPTVAIGGQLQLRGRGLVNNQRVTFRWSRGALASKLHHGRSGYVVRIPTGTAQGAISVSIRDRAGRRSNVKRILVIAPAPRPTKVPTDTSLPAAFRGDGMWIWMLNKSNGGNLAAIASQAKASGISTVFVKAGDGTTRWAQFTPQLVQSLHALGLKVCAWNYVYGKNPAGEAATAASAIKTGADCFVIDAESEYEGRYTAAQQYMSTLRAAVGSSYPIGLTSFPYVDYHPGLPFSVFLAPGNAQVNLPQVYWKAIGTTVDAASAHTYANNRIYQRPIAPLGQTYESAPTSAMQRFRQVWAAYGSGGLSWWDWQESSSSQFATLGHAAPGAASLTDPGWPALGKGAKGDQVYWLQQHLHTADATVAMSGKLDSAGVAALKAFQTANGIPPTGVTNAATWQAALKLDPSPINWSAR